MTGLLGLTILASSGTGGEVPTVADFARHQQKTPLALRPQLIEIEHARLCFDETRYCGHPRQGIFAYFGGGEIVVGHNHAPCKYQLGSDVAHDLGGYHSRAVMLLQRSTDGGKSWPEANNVVVYDETTSEEKKAAFLFQQGAPRPSYDMLRPESLFFFGRTYMPVGQVCFCLRSPDNGRTWETVPGVIAPPVGAKQIHKDCHPVVRLPDGKTLLGAMSVGAGMDRPGSVDIYASTDQGLSWNPIGTAAVDSTGLGRFTYANLLLRPDGELQCYFLHITFKRDYDDIDGIKNTICMTSSRDGGRTWGEIRPIVGKGRACWDELAARQAGDPGNQVRDWVYRSPWPIALQDGRILVAFARRRGPMGIGAVISSDNGATWSEEAIVRGGDTNVSDLGYPVGCQLDDGRVFLAYYYTEPREGGYNRAIRYIAGTHFRVADAGR